MGDGDDPGRASDGFGTAAAAGCCIDDGLGGPESGRRWTDYAHPTAESGAADMRMGAAVAAREGAEKGHSGCGRVSRSAIEGDAVPCWSQLNGGQDLRKAAKGSALRLCFCSPVVSLVGVHC